MHDDPSTSLVAPDTLRSKVRENIPGFVAGIATGLTKLVVGHPFDTIKVRLQTEGPKGRFQGPVHCIRATISKEGFFALYKGSTPPLVGWAITDAIQAGTYTNTKNYLMKEFQLDPSKNYSVHAISGLAAGWASSITSTPMEQIKARLQVQYDGASRRYTGPIDCVKQLVHQRGFFKGLWGGFSASLLLRSHFAILWPTYQYTSRVLESWEVPHFASAIPFFAGGTAATLFWAVGFPSDVVKNRIMSQPIGPGPLQYPSVVATFKIIYQQGGLRGFYRGFLPAILRSFPTNGAALLVYEKAAF
ncbi:hypothetical protein DSO57_1015088 [Entomophthora muscae]|uniref:Uncharacterized protein n=1 Tax=Entomophthora muscae TaxID=34485 RepID=A0ACC2T566_9FUNG|nr:hypothetical protein DSO57_1015088 [Entomophthora muscae]